MAIGLYSSTYGIVLKEAKQHLKIILSAVTVGVFLKALFIGSILSWLFHDPFFFLLGIMVAQIDPLSVSKLMHGTRLSAKAKTILASWASFDDPITVILCLYAPILLAQITGSEWLSLTDIDKNANGIQGYLDVFLFNLGFAGLVFLIWKLSKKQLANRLLRSSHIALLGGSIAVTVSQLWMLSVALIGLFLRPPIDLFIEKAIQWSLRMAAILLGVLLVSGVNLLYGVALGIAAFTAQILVGMLLTRGLVGKDRIHIAFAQQNGITAIILSLLFEPLYPRTVSIIAPAILVINTIHAVSNQLLDRFVLQK
ncbi:MAG: hypothetical protein AAB553_00695 [Patescibacteria group bacterium]